MLKFVTLALVLIVASVSAQRSQKVVLDSFETQTDLILLQAGASGVTSNNPLVGTRIATGSGIVGGERDAQLTVETSTANQIFTTNVDSGQWVTSTPNGGSGFALLQYDGSDNSLNLATSGLNTYDLTQNGGDAFIFDIQTDVDSIFTVTVYQGGNTCEREVDLPGEPGGDDITYELRFNDFSGNCNFAAVGAIELLVEAFANVDVIVSRFATVGPNVSPSPSPSRSPEPSRQAPPPPPPPPAASPSPSTPPPPPPMEMCMCECPTFRCGVVYKIHDDDDDTVDDDTHDDDDLIYRPVYYGPADDDFDALTGDDDENEFISFEGGLTLTGIHDDDDYNVYQNDAGVLTLSVLLAASLLVVLL